MSTIRIGIVGLGTNTRDRHVPGFNKCEDVEIVGVCNRSEESSRAAAEAFGISKIYDNWQQLVADDDVDAVMVGTWPYLHRDVTVAGLDAGKHVLTEARMAHNASEAREMLAASQRNPGLVAQIVPSPFGLRVHQVVTEMLADGYIGELREAVVLGLNASCADPDVPLHWRQSAELSGINMLTLGILHETLVRWIPHPTRVLAQTQTFIPERTDPATGRAASVGTPDSVHVLTEIPGGARGIYHLSGTTHFGPGLQIHLYGSKGTLKYSVTDGDRLLGGQQGDQNLTEIEVPAVKAGGWRVEEEFIGAIRGLESVRLTDFETGVRYMEFTEAVSRSARSGQAEVVNT